VNLVNLPYFFFNRLERDFYIIFGQINYDQDFADVMRPDYVWLCSILLTFHVIFCFLVLLNILIAMLGDTFAEIKENADKEWHLVYAEIILSIEKEMGYKTIESSGTEYWTNVNSKRWLTIQEVNKDYFGKVVESEPTLSEILKEMDTNNDGKITLAELEAGERKLREAGLVASINLGEGGVTLASGGEHHAKFDQNFASLGPDGHSDGRLDPSIFVVKN